MPLVKRTVEPTHISRVVIETSTQNELECMSNMTLSNVIHQLSSLSAHAEDLFTELYHETCYAVSRMEQLNDRVDRLKTKITQLNAVEEVSLQDINLRKPFRSSLYKDQQVITLDSRPAAVTAAYQHCDTAPPLHKLNQFREDGKDSMKFYTDPGHFFEQWYQQITAKDTDVQTKKQKQRNRKPRQNKPSTIRVPKSRGEELSAMRHGPELREALKKSQSETADVTAVGSRSSAVQVQQSTHVLEYALTNGTVGPQQPHGPSLIAQQTMSGYWSPKNYNSDSDYQVPTTKLSLQHSLSNTARPLMPPPAPPSPQQLMTSRNGPVQNPDYPAVHEPSPARMMPNRDSLPPPPPAPLSLLEVDQSQSAVSDYTQQSAAMIVDTVAMYTEYDLPPPPVPPPDDDISPGLEGAPVDDLPESPLPLPPEDVDVDVMVVPPLPPPLVKPEPTIAARHSTEVDDKLDHLQPDTVSLSSEASSQATKLLSEDTCEAAIRAKRSDLLDAIRKGIHLRSVESSKRKKTTTGKPDVQEIMEAAFERRRRAIEENDSDHDDDDEGDWDDET